MRKNLIDKLYANGKPPEPAPVLIPTDLETKSPDVALAEAYIDEIRAAGDNEEKKKAIRQKYSSLFPDTGDMPLDAAGILVKDAIQQFIDANPNAKDLHAGAVLDALQTGLSPESRATYELARLLEPLPQEQRKAAIKMVRDKFIQGEIDKKRIGLLKRDITELDRKLYDAREDMVGVLDNFVEFCQMIRGYENPRSYGDPSAHLMAMGRLFVGQEDVALAEFAELLEQIEYATKYVKWEEIAPNALSAYTYLAAQSKNEAGAWLVHFSRSWALNGYPVVELGHKTAAALMFTDGDPDELVESPWKSFIIKVPDGLVVLDGRTLAHILVWNAPEDMKRRWWMMFEFRTSEKKWSTMVIGVPSLDSSEKEIREQIEVARGMTTEEDAHNLGTKELAKAMMLGARLVAGACMLMSSKEDVLEQPWRPKTPKDRRRPAGIEPPEGTRFIHSKNVEIDLRPQVNQFLNSRRLGGKITVQFPVRGHRRNQAYGPRHTLRKAIWIMPFWKGPTEAVALFRGYEFKQARPELQEPAGEPAAGALPEPPPEPPKPPGGL